MNIVDSLSVQAVNLYLNIAVQCSVLKSSAVNFSDVHCSAVQFSVVQCSAVQGSVDK